MAYLSPNVISVGAGDFIGVLANGASNDIILKQSNGIYTRNQGIYLKSAIVRITSAQLLALNATPIQVIAAPTTNYIVKIDDWTVRHDTGTAYTVSTTAKNLALKYTNGAGNIAATVINATGFLDQATAQIRTANALAINGASATAVGDLTPVANAAIVVQMLSGEITGGNYDILLYINYRLVPTDYTA